MVKTYNCNTKPSDIFFKFSWKKPVTWEIQWKYVISMHVLIVYTVFEIQFHSPPMITLMCRVFYLVHVQLSGTLEYDWVYVVLIGSE